MKGTNSLAYLDRVSTTEYKTFNDVKDATTLCIMTFSITTFGITTHSLMEFIATLSINDTQHMYTLAQATSVIILSVTFLLL